MRIAAFTAGLLALSLFPSQPAHAAAREHHLLVMDGSQVGYHVKVKTLVVVDETIDSSNQKVQGEVWLPADGQPRGWVEAAISGFHSGIKGRDHHVARMLGAPDRSVVRFQLTGLTGYSPEHPDGQAVAEGSLSANGHTHPLQVPVHYHLAGDTLVVDGEAPLHFTDYGIDPPVLGLLLKRAPDLFSIRVHVVASEPTAQAR